MTSNRRGREVGVKIMNGGATILSAVLAVLATSIVAIPSAADDAWVPLIDAASFDDWTIEGLSQADYRYADGVVTGQPVGSDPKNSFLCSPREYGDFELSFAFRIAPIELNSGLQFRSHVREDGTVAGPQFEMEVAGRSDASFKIRYLAPIALRFMDIPWSPRYQASGGVYGEGLETGWIYPGVAGGDADAFEEQGERITEREDWNEARLEAIGDRVRTWLAGEPRADYEHAETSAPGRICLQVHGGEYEDPSQHRVQWKDLKIRDR